MLKNQEDLTPKTLLEEETGCVRLYICVNCDEQVGRLQLTK